MLKRWDAVGYNPACLKVDSPSFLPLLLFFSPVRFPPLLSSSSAPVRCASPSILPVTVYRGWPVPKPGGRGCSHTACPPLSDGARRVARGIRGGRRRLSQVRVQRSASLTEMLKNRKSSFRESQDWLSAATTAQ